MTFCNWIVHAANFFDWNLLKPNNSSQKVFFFSPYQKQYSKTMGNALHTYSSMLFTFSIKPKQDKNVNLKKFSFGD